MTFGGSFVIVDGETLPAIGSRWYWLGKHWEIVSHEETEQQPGVRMRILHAPRKAAQHVKPWALVARKAVPSQA
jgi:hypothetical protein